MKRPTTAGLVATFPAVTAYNTDFTSNSFTYPSYFTVMVMLPL